MHAFYRVVRDKFALVIWRKPSTGGDPAQKRELPLGENDLSAKITPGEPLEADTLTSEPRHPGKRLPRPSNTVLAQLSDRWRVIYDPLQWVLQRKESEERQKSSGWNNRSYCVTKEGLIRRIREFCG